MKLSSPAPEWRRDQEDTAEADELMFCRLTFTFNPSVPTTLSLRIKCISLLLLEVVQAKSVSATQSY